MTSHANPLPVRSGEGIDPMLQLCKGRGAGAREAGTAEALQSAGGAFRRQNFARTAVEPLASIRWTDFTTSMFAGSVLTRTFPLALLFTVPALCPFTETVKVVFGETPEAIIVKRSARLPFLALVKA